MVFGIKAVKFLLFIFNFIFAIFGIAILALGVVYKLQIEAIIQYLGDDFPVAPDLFIAIGTVAFIISFFGCIGASRENRPMLIAFVILLVILLVIELAVVIIAFVELGNGTLEKNIGKIIEQEKEQGRLGKVEVKEVCGVHPQKQNPVNQQLEGSEVNQCSKLKEAIFTLVTTSGGVNINLECCGVIDPIDTYGNFSNMPDTCFKDLEKISENFYSHGCLKKIKDLFHSVGLQLGAIAIAVSIIEIIGSLFALTLSNISKKNRS